MLKPTALRLAAAAILLAGTAGCASGKKDLKAKAARPSAFIANPTTMQPQRERAPFNSAWVSPTLLQRAAQYTAIYVAPVNTRYLRAVDRALVVNAKDRPVAETAGLLQTGFASAFRNSPSPRLKVASGPGPGVLTLQLALIELNPTNVVGNAAKYGAPGGSVLAPLTKGNIAIEGKVTDSVTGELFYQFADNEQDPFSAVSLRDLSAYGHSRTAIKDWARQLEELTRTPRTHRVADSATFTLNPF